MIAIFAPGMYGYTQAAYPLIKKVDNGISSFLAGWNNKNQPQDKVLSTDNNGQAVYAAPGTTDTNTNSQTTPESPF